MKALSLLTLVLCAGPALCQQAPAAGYDVIVIRPNTTASGHTHVSIDPGSYTATNVSLKAMLVGAYGLQTADQLIGLPGWAGGVRYDVTAKVDAETAAQMKKLDHAHSNAVERQAEQMMLETRFGLKAHHETRELPEYALVQAKGGSKLKAGDELAPKAGGVHESNSTLTAVAVRLEELTSFLAGQLRRAVVDQTGLTGKFDLSLVWTPDGTPDAATAERAPGLLTALEEQMGLKVESTKGPVDVLVVDELKPPTEN